MTRFLLLTHGTRGDIEPFVAVGGRLVGRGHDVTVLTHAPYGPAVRAAGADFFAIDDDAGYAAHLRRTPALLQARPSELLEFYRTGGLFEQIRREVAALRAGGDDVVIVGRHLSGFAALIAAEALGAPVALVALSPTQLMTTPMAAMNLTLALGSDLNRIRTDEGLAPVTDWARWIRAADVMIGLWPHWFDQAGPKSGADVALTGFPLADRELADQELADREVASGRGRRSDDLQTPFPSPDELHDVVLVTGGTGRMLHPGFYPAALAGLALAGRRGIVVTPHRDLLPERLPDGVVHLPALPFAEVLPKVAGIVHHGGIGTFARAIVAGAPQLVLAHGGDRPDNARRLARLDLASHLVAARWNAEAVADGLRDLDSPRRRAVAADFAARMLDPDPLDALADRLVTLAGPREPLTAAARGVAS